MQTFLSNISTISTWCYKKRKKITKLLEKFNNVPYFLNNSCERLFLFLHQKGFIIWGKAIIPGRRLLIFKYWLKYWLFKIFCFTIPLKMKENMTSNKLNMGFLSVPNMVPWLIFRAWIITDQFCWIILTGRGKRKRRYGKMCGEQ